VILVVLVSGALTAVGARARGDESAAAPSRVPHATSFKICAAAGPFWPTQTLATRGTTAWIACKEASRVTQYDLVRGRATRSIRVDAPVIAVVTGYGSLWALDSAATLYRIALPSMKIVRRLPLPTGKPYNIWVGAGSIWVVDDDAGALIRVSPEKNKVTARIPVGDGAADIVFQGSSAWIVNHRDRGLVHLDTRTNVAKQLATLEAEVPERMVILADSLWVTGRGSDLWKIDPGSGAASATIEIGASGIDVVASNGALWVPTRSAAVDPTGFPTMEALRRVTVDGTVKTVSSATGRVDVHGLAPAASGGGVWLADNTAGVLYRVRP
jgi:streptogramin lyase